MGDRAPPSAWLVKWNCLQCELQQAESPVPTVPGAGWRGNPNISVLVLQSDGPQQASNRVSEEESTADWAKVRIYHSG